MKKSATNLALFFCLWLCASTAWAQAFNWANSVYNVAPSTQGQLDIKATAIDASGNIYAAASTRGPVMVGTQLYSAGDSTDGVVVIKYTSAGAIAWSKRFGSTFLYSSYVADMKVDAAGNVFVLGHFRNNLVIDGATFTTTSNEDYFLAKFSTAGALLWFKQGGGAGYRVARSLALDAFGSIAITGFYSGTSNFGTIVLTAPSNSDNAFCLKMDSTGNVMWAKSANSGPARSFGSEVAMDPAGNVIMVGAYTSGSFTWGSQTAPGTTTFRMFWLKLNQSGLAIDIFTLPMFNPPFSPGFNQLDPVVLAVDDLGYSYVSNSFVNTIDLGGITLTSGGSRSTYLAKYNPTGVLQWAQKVQAPTLHLAVGQSLALDGEGKAYLAGKFSSSIAIGPLSLSANGNSAFVVAFDQFTGDPVWAQKGEGSDYIEGNAVSAAFGGQVALGGNFKDGPVTLGNTSTGAAAPDSLQSMYVSRLIQNYNSITGSVFIDSNLNGVQNPGEVGFDEGNMVQVSPGLAAFHSTAAGPYNAVAELGTFDVSIPNPPLYYNVVSSGPAPVNFSTFGNVSAGHNFALQAIPNQQDLQVVLTPLQGARPGFTTSYRITYRNLGTVAIPAGTVSLSFNPLMTFLSSTQPHTLSGNTLTWAYSNLQPGQTRNINVLFSIPTTAVVGTSLSATASVAPLAGDLTPADNSETNTRPITASYDPNLIQVNYEELTTQQVQDGQWLTYTIHFQNLGTDTAFTVMLRDSLNPQLFRTNTIQMQAVSHNCSWSVNSAGRMTVLFTNIKLPHQGVNVVASNGFIRFRIRPQQSLLVGDIIPNRAHIYFDYNPKITTNTALTVVVEPSGTADNLVTQSASVWPNPVQDVLTLNAELAAAGAVRISIHNVLGQEVYSKQIEAGAGTFQQQVEVQHLPSGMYLLQLHIADGVYKQMVVKN